MYASNMTLHTDRVISRMIEPTFVEFKEKKNIQNEKQIKKKCKKIRVETLSRKFIMFTRTTPNITPI